MKFFPLKFAKYSSEFVLSMEDLKKKKKFLKSLLISRPFFFFSRLISLFLPHFTLCRPDTTQQSASVAVSVAVNSVLSNHFASDVIGEIIYCGHRNYVRCRYQEDIV